MIEVKNVHKSFDGHVVLDNISAEMQDGHCNMIIGQSGSGKTVLMKSIIGLHTIDSGRIEYDGRNLPDMKEKEVRMLRREVGMLFQGSALFDSMTIEENVTFPLDMFTDQSDSEKHDRANFCLECVDLENVNKLYPAELSGGMKKRAAIARALACNPKYLFFDEPNSGLDPKTSLLIDDLITKITHEFNTTTVVNTHDLNSIITIGETISFIYQGHLAWRGNSDNILTSDDQTLNDFIYAQPLTQRLRKTL